MQNEKNDKYHDKSSVVLETVKGYLEQFEPNNPPAPEQFRGELIASIEARFELENSTKEKGRKWKIPDTLPPRAIAEAIMRFDNVIRLAWSDCLMDDNFEDDNFDLAVYKSNSGLYIASKQELKRLIRKYDKCMSEHDVYEVLSILESEAPRKTRTIDGNLIAVNNGVFDYANKKLLPFSPDFVFTTKSPVNYNPTATNITIHNPIDDTDWDIESWMNELSDDADVVNLLWELLGAVVRPYTDWNKMVCLYDERGCNGKGTFCQLARNLVGEWACASVPFADFSKDFALEKLTHTLAIITDENETKIFIKDAKLLKDLVSHDPMGITRKFDKNIDMRFYGVVIQCINDFPKFSDKSQSFYRRLLFIPFTKCFTGRERKYIKRDYLQRPDVLEYVMYKVLNMDYDAFSIPQVCESLLSTYKSFNDSTRAFLEEMLPLCQWDLLPFSFLYELYKAWMKKNCPLAQLSNKQTFIKDIKNMIKDFDDWSANDRPISTRNLMDKPELLIMDYDLKDWQNPVYKGSDVTQMCKPMLAQSYRGLQRK